MIPIEEAIAHIDKVPFKLTTEMVKLSDSLHKILAQDVTSPINMPPFRQSAMDGYAIKFSSCDTYKIIEESKAGDNLQTTVNEGEAVRIFTGAMVPEGADTVVIQEHVIKENDHIQITKQPKPNANVRPIGEQVHAGDLVLNKGQKLTEATIGFLAGLGIAVVEVYKQPRVSILVTGNELQSVGTPLEPGKIYESNAIMLEMALKNIDIQNVKTYRVSDTLEETIETIKTALSNSEVILISGGISVGDYDFVKRGLEANGVKEIFYKVRQKPGKPLWFGKTDAQYVLALPGNPASALTGFYMYATPLIKKLSGYQNIHYKRIKATSNTDFNNGSGRALFLKSIVNDDNTVDILHGQQSSMLNTYAISNALAFIPHDLEEVKQGDLVECVVLGD
jgi:molybdopterin molybdotransferase